VSPKAEENTNERENAGKLEAEAN